MDNVNQQKIEFNRERNLLLLLNDSMRFIGKNFNPIFQGVYCIVIPFILLVVGFFYLPENVRSSPFISDSLSIIYKLKASLGFNGLYVLVLAYLESVVIYHYINIYYKSAEGTVITYFDIYKKIKENMVSLFSMLMVLIVGLSAIVLALTYLDNEMTDIFGFSLFYILALFVPFICYFFTSTLFIGVLENLNLLEAAKRVSANFKNYTLIWINTTVLLVGVIVLQKMITSTFAAIYNLLSMEVILKIYPVLNAIEQLVTAGIIAIFLVISAFSYMGQEENMKGKKLLSRIDEIK